MRTKCLIASALFLSCVSCAPIPARRVASIDNRVASIQPAWSIHIESEGRLASCLAWSPNGQLLLVGCSNGDVEVLNFDGTPKIERTLKAGSDDVQAISWMHDGTTFITCGRVILDNGENIVRFWDAANYQQKRAIRVSAGATRTVDSKGYTYVDDGLFPNSATFSADGSLLIWSEIDVATGETHIAVMSTESGQKAVVAGPFGDDSREMPVFISPDQRHVYWRNMAWDLQTTPHLALTNQRKFALPIFAYSADGRWGYVVEALYPHDLTSQSPMVNIYYPEALYQVELATGQIETRRDFTVARKVMHGFSTAVSPDGELLAIASEWDVHIIDLQANKDLGRCVTTDLASGIRSLSFSPDGKSLAGRTTLGAYVWKVPSTH